MSAPRACLLVLALPMLPACSEPKEAQQQAITAAQDADQVQYARELEALRADPWFAEPQGEISYDQSEHLADCEQVERQAIERTVRLLEQSASVRIDATTASELIGPEKAQLISNPVLIRAFATEYSHIEVRANEGSLVLWLGYLGSFAGARRWPCVADVREAPASVTFVLSGAI
jgi:hypothetical protein